MGSFIGGGRFSIRREKVKLTTLKVVGTHQKANASTGFIEKTQAWLLLINNIDPIWGIEAVAPTPGKGIVSLLVGEDSQAAKCHDIQNETCLHVVPKPALDSRAKGEGKEEALVHDGREGVEDAEEGVRKSLDQ